MIPCTRIPVGLLESIPVLGKKFDGGRKRLEENPRSRTQSVRYAAPDAGSISAARTRWMHAGKSRPP